eukprot:8055246-Karenia_brevis.AAC.1
MAFTLAGVGDDLDPSYHILYRRLLLVRRTLAKFPHYLSDIKYLLKSYQHVHHIGTKHADLNMSSLRPAPPPGDPGRAQWKSSKT